MFQLNTLIAKQGQLILKDNRHALIVALILLLIPYVGCFSLAVMALVTLRKGWRSGAFLVIPLCFVNQLISGYPLQWFALLSTALTILPCYMAACLLRLTTSWRAIFAVFFVMLLLVAVCLQWMTPEVITTQYTHIMRLVEKMQPDSPLLELLQSQRGVDQDLVANYFLGMQALGIVFSALVPLLLARSVQSQLYYPGGYRQEMLSFRAERIDVLLLIVVLISSVMHHVVAINVLPLLIAYFMLAGFSLSAYVLAGRGRLRYWPLLIVLLFVLPFIMLPVCVFLGVIDVLFNFRLYLSTTVGKT